MCSLFFFEGLPGSGKSTIISKLKDDLGDSCLIFPKLDVASTLFKCLQFDFDKHGTIPEKVALLLEEIKCELLNNLSGTPEIILIERSYVSLLAYNYVLSKTNLPNIYTKSVEHFTEYQYKFTHYFIYLKIDPLLSIRRDRHYYSDFWKREENLRLISDYYDTFFVSKNEVKIVNAEGNESTVLAACKEFMNVCAL